MNSKTLTFVKEILQNKVNELGGWKE